MPSILWLALGALLAVGTMYRRVAAWDRLMEQYDPAVWLAGREMLERARRRHAPPSQ